MSEQLSQPGQPSSPQPGQTAAPTQADLKRQVREAKAVAKANRSWFGRHKVLTALGAVAVVAVVAAIGSGGDDAPAAPGTTASVAAGTDGTDTVDAAAETPAEAPAEAPAEQSAGVGTAVRDGKFEFTVTAVEPGVAQVGDEFLNKAPQGQFVLVHLTVANIGDRAQMFYDDAQKAYDAAGRQFSADTEAGIYLEDSNAFLKEINPGNTVEGILVFDVPTDVTLASLELHDSLFSGGVTVALG
ncbi:DUF4352 domain-containing protein [Xylanimonas oleitrophica]|uniref:DUF4352 domain-containing protein n=1 Tax=Xylanimonas oleitrophica TaxID=2607479 RepID=A0A2W5WWJ8_9MICO|nr:DUF4352 domain-containing protein [Xylanimonas oleitrophica]PZR55012.1 DUF4352 domain-containing protein [Xylanimonas oleitrophica]